MTEKKVTIVISPRDRFSGLSDCIDLVYRYTDEQLFDLIILDLGYPKAELLKAQQSISGKSNASILSYGLMIPMEGLLQVQGKIKTPFIFLLDNDSRVSENWLPPLIETGEKSGAAVIAPLILETDGVDGAYTRNHSFNVEIRVVDVGGAPYLIEHKLYRRELPENMPTKIQPTQAFELHGVMFRTDAFDNIELPYMTIREHLDIGMQLTAKGELLFAEPKSIIYFDNVGTRGQLNDLKYFNYRWNAKIAKYSHELFEKRWGYKWYGEQAIYYWCVRRKIYMLLRWLYIPIPAANFIDRLVSSLKRRISPIWDPIPNPNEVSTLLYDRLEGNKAVPLSHDIKL